MTEIKETECFLWIGWIEEMLLMELVLTIFSSLTDQDGIKCKCKAVGAITRLVEVIIVCTGGIHSITTHPSGNGGSGSPTEVSWGTRLVNGGRWFKVVEPQVRELVRDRDAGFKERIL